MDWLSTIVTFSIDKLGVAGFVLSILFVLVTILVLTFRWSHISGNQRFVLIIALVVVAAVLAAFVVFTADRPPQKAKVDEIDLLASLNPHMPKHYFESVFGKPILEASKESDSAEVYTKGDTLVATLRDANGLTAFAVIFKSGRIPTFYWDDLKARFGEKQLLKEASIAIAKHTEIRKANGTIDGKTDWTMKQPMFVASEWASAVYLKLHNRFDLREVGVVFATRADKKEGCPIEIAPSSYFEDLVKACGLRNGPAIGFAKVLGISNEVEALFGLYGMLDQAGLKAILAKYTPS